MTHSVFLVIYMFFLNSKGILVFFLIPWKEDPIFEYTTYLSHRMWLNQTVVKMKLNPYWRAFLVLEGLCKLPVEKSNHQL